MIGSELHQLRHIAWLTIVYTISVATMQPLVSPPPNSPLPPFHFRIDILLAVQSSIRHLRQKSTAPTSLSIVRFRHSTLVNPIAASPVIILTDSSRPFSAITVNYWLLVVSRLIVGAGSAGLGYMVALIFNGKA